jgi:hypothetical protein
LDLLRSDFPKDTFERLLARDRKADVAICVSGGKIDMIVLDNLLRDFLKTVQDKLIERATSAERFDLGALRYAAEVLRMRGLDHDTGDPQDVRGNLLALASMLSGSVDSLRNVENNGHQTPELEALSKDSIRKVADVINKWSDSQESDSQRSRTEQATQAQEDSLL